MHFRLKLWLFEIELKTPEVQQVSTADIAAVIWSAATQQHECHVVYMEADADDDTTDVD